jgi:predicted ATPase
LTSFVGREQETEALALALDEHRLVTAVGPGGVGKTRLVIRVAGAVAERYDDGVCFVDLVPVTEPDAVAAAVATALGLGESQDRTVEEVLTGWLTTRRMLLVLDNCEHVIEGVSVLVELLLRACAGLTVLATSRSRLLLPFESVFAVPGLSLAAADDHDADAVALFLSRAAVGGTETVPDDLERVAALCRGLDGMALAIELAAARLPALGLDGLEAGLADRLRLLEGGSRVDDRHRSLRSALDWSYALLSEAERATLRRLSVFAGGFSVQAATELVAGWDPVSADEAPSVLASLAEQSLLVTLFTPLGTRYRALETIRQYGAAQLVHTDESDEAHARHLAWCLASAERLDSRGATGRDGSRWHTEFDEVSVEVRRCLPWARYRAEQRDPAYRVSLLMAGLSFERGRPGESQRRYELAAELAPDGTAATAALRRAAGAAETRHFGTEAFRLWRMAADSAEQHGDPGGAAMALARAAELVGRAPGLMHAVPPPAEVDRLLARARLLAVGDAAAESRILSAEAFARDERGEDVGALVDEALQLARRAGDPLCESAALDVLTSVQLARGDVTDAMHGAVHRTELLTTVELTPESALEVFDAYQMAAQCAVAAGDLEAGRRMGEGLRSLPFYREEDHLATSRLIVVGLFAGNWDETLELAELFRAGWQRADRPVAGNLRPTPYAVAAIHGLRGDEQARADWMRIVDVLETPTRTLTMVRFGQFFDALVLLHRGEFAHATEVLAVPPETFDQHYTGTWRAWYASAWAEAAVLAGLPDADERLRRAALLTGGNPIVEALLRRATGLAEQRSSGGDGGRDDVVAAASALKALGARYQWARTLVMLGGAEAVDGLAELAEMGAAPMAWPPG